MLEPIIDGRKEEEVTTGSVIDCDTRWLWKRIFTTADGRPMDPNAFQKHEFTDAVTAAGIGNVRFHEQGENGYYIQRQIGHSSIQVTIDVCGHLLETRNPDAAAKTDALIFGKKKARARSMR